MTFRFFFSLNFAITSCNFFWINFRLSNHLRGPVLTLTSRREAPSCDGTDGRDGRTDGQQKFASILYILCWHLEHVYILKYIVKNCHQHCYGFQNLMSSWGWGSKFSNLLHGDDFSILGSKSSHLQGVLSTRHLQIPFGVQRHTPHDEHEARVYELDGMDGWNGMGWDGLSKVSFKYLYTLWAYRTCIYLLICIYILKNCHQHSYGFQNFLLSWGS